MMVRNSETQLWSLIGYSIGNENNLIIDSELLLVNSVIIEDTLRIVDVVSSEKYLVILFTDRVMLYNWNEDSIELEQSLEEEMSTIIPEFSQDGSILKFILKDQNRRVYLICDIQQGICRIDMGKCCKLVVPIFKDYCFWTLDENNIQSTISIVDGRKLSENKLSIKNSKKAVYIPVIKRLLILTEAGEVRAGELSSGSFVLCGNLSVDFKVVDIVAGNSEVTLVGETELRYISFDDNVHEMEM
jgi:hypothetical protein